MSAPIDVVLQRLDKVKANGNGKWKACCPAHHDKDPSLSIREASDGKVLLHCWAECSTEEIVAAIGLTFADLRPDSDQRHVRRGPSQAAVRHERAVYQIGMSMQMQGLQLNEMDQARLELAKKRLGVNQ